MNMMKKLVYGAAMLCAFAVNARADGVMFVKADATGSGDGSSWANAYTDFNTALAAAVASGGTVSEIWLKGDFEASAAPSAVTISDNLCIRGGFAGTETAAGERAAGALSVFSGNDTYNIMEVNVAVGKTLSFERVVFTRAYNCALKKTGNGSLVITESSISQNGRAFGHNKNKLGTGCGLNVSGSGTLSVSSTTIEGNGPINYPENSGGGWGVYVTGSARAFFDDCSFVTNCTNKLGYQGDDYGGKHRGAALWAENSPVTLRGCRFAGNAPRIGQTAGGGATVFLQGTCGGSAFTNCTFVGNCELLSNSAVTGGGTLRIDLNNSSDTVDIKGCTFAYNLSQTMDASAGISIVKGAVSVTESTLFYNLLGHSCANHRGNDIYVGAAGRLAISNSTLTSRDYSIGSASGAVVSVDDATITTDDPKFVSSPLDFESLLSYAGAVCVNRNADDRWPSVNYAKEADIFAKMAALDVTPLDPRPTKPDIGSGNVLYVKAGATGTGDGSSWGDAFTDLESALAAVSAAKSEVWIAGDLAPSAAPTPVYIENDVVVRGGFAGTESSADERTEGSRTLIDGADAYDLLVVSLKADVDVAFERIDFKRAKARAFDMRGFGNVSFSCCDFEGNGRETQTVDGRAIRAMAGQGEASLSVSNCTFAGQMYKTLANDTGNGAAIYAANLARLTVDDSLFVTNGLPKGNGNGGGRHVHGWAVCASSTPVTMRSARFSGNCGILSNAYGSTRDGGVVYIDGAASGSAFTNCVFTGNFELRKNGDNTYGGALVFAPSAAGMTLDIENCTFAYNVSQGSQCASALNVKNGSVTVHNSIFWQNPHGFVAATAYGSEIDVAAGTVSVSHTILTSTDITACHGTGSTSISLDAGTVYTSDPLFVTSNDDFADLFTYGSSVVEPSAAWTYDAATSLDVHLLSPAAYFLNDGTVGPATESFSPAIDSGDPASDFSREPGSNGGRVNLGAYGNTAYASETPTGQPKVASLEVVGTTGGYARPSATLVTGIESGVDYSAIVTLTCSTGGVVVATKTVEGVANGVTIAWAVPLYLPAGVVAEIGVSISADAATTVADSASATVSGEYPDFYGKGGGEGILHVRAGADCLMNGADWTDAFPDLDSAIAAVNANTREIWLAAGVRPSSATITTDAPLVIRGGFSGTENSASERAEGAMTEFDYADLAPGFNVANSAPIEFERFAMLNASTRAFEKTGAGDFTLNSCRIAACGTHDITIFGRALYATGGQSAVVTITNCVIEGNMTVDYKRGEASNHGAAVRVESCKRLFVDDSLFASNGMQVVDMTGAYSFFGNVQGSAIYANATPVAARRTRFAANCTGNRGSGAGTVFLNGNCSGSAFTNCAFVGNFERIDGSNPNSNYGGALCVNLDQKTRTVDVEGCTFAYNVTSSSGASAGIDVVKGTVNVHNSIIWNNQRYLLRDSGVANDIQVQKDGVCSVSHSIVTSLETDSCMAASGGTLTFAGDTVYAVDPLFASPTDFFNQVYTIGDTDITTTSLFTYGTLSGFDVHLQSSARYVRNDGTSARSPGVNSPAIDLGDPASAYDAEPEPNGKRVNLGAYGNTQWASLSRVSGFFIIVR